MGQVVADQDELGGERSWRRRGQVVAGQDELGGKRVDPSPCSCAVVNESAAAARGGRRRPWRSWGPNPTDVPRAHIRTAEAAAAFLWFGRRRFFGSIDRIETRVFLSIWIFFDGTV